MFAALGEFKLKVVLNVSHSMTVMMEAICLTICHIIFHVSLTTASCWKEMKCLRSGQVLPFISVGPGLSCEGSGTKTWVFVWVQHPQSGAGVSEEPRL